jgi:hypothetical protein
MILISVGIELFGEKPMQSILLIDLMNEMNALIEISFQRWETISACVNENKFSLRYYVAKKPLLDNQLVTKRRKKIAFYCVHEQHSPSTLLGITLSQSLILFFFLTFSQLGANGSETFFNFVGTYKELDWNSLW